MRAINFSDAAPPGSIVHIHLKNRDVHHGTLISATEHRATVRCADGVVRSVPWTVERKANRCARRTYDAVFLLSAREAWFTRRPETKTMTFSNYGNSVEVSIDALGTEEFRSELAEVIEWARQDPINTVEKSSE